jgi:hypothetical protein
MASTLKAPRSRRLNLRTSAQQERKHALLGPAYGMPGFFLVEGHPGITIASIMVCQPGTRRLDMKYGIAWLLGVPGVLIVGGSFSTTCKGRPWRILAAISKIPSR